MNNLKILKELVKDFDVGIDFVHENVISNYIELRNLRNKKAQVEKLIKNLSGKK